MRGGKVIDAKELQEFEDYFRGLEAGAGEHRSDLSIQAGTAVILCEILKALRPDLEKPQPKKD